MALIDRVQRHMARHGADLTFPAETARTYNALTNAWTESTTREAVTVKAVKTRSDPDTLTRLSLVPERSITLLVAAKQLTIAIAVRFSFSFGGEDYSVKEVVSRGPNGTPVFYVVTGAR